MAKLGQQVTGGRGKLGRQVGATPTTTTRTRRTLSPEQRQQLEQLKEQQKYLSDKVSSLEAERKRIEEQLKTTTAQGTREGLRERDNFLRGQLYVYKNALTQSNQNYLLNISRVDLAARKSGEGEVYEEKIEDAYYESLKVEQQPAGSYVVDGQGMSISREELEEGLREGDIKGGGTYRSLSDDYYSVSVTPGEQVQTKKEPITFDEYLAKQSLFSQPSKKAGDNFPRAYGAEVGGSYTTKQPEFFADIKDIFFTEKKFSEFGKEPGLKARFQEGVTAVVYPVIAIGGLIRQSSSDLSKEGYFKTGSVVGGIGDLFPKTAGGTAAVVGGVKGFSMLPKGLRIGGSATISAFEAPKIISPDKSLREKTTSAIIAGGGALGFAAETTPYVRGLRARASPDYFKIKPQPEGFKAIEIPFKQQLSPEDYAFYLQQKGKLSFEYLEPATSQNKVLLGQYSPMGITGKPTVRINPDLYGIDKQITIAHELIHYKTPKWILNSPLEKLPYRTQPSEVLAFGLQKRFAMEGFKVRATGRIGLIPSGSPLRTGETKNVQLPKVSPLKRGGFEVKPSEKSLFIRGGDEQYLTTSQRDFFQEGKVIKLSDPLYLTPEEPFLKIPETRESRLGLAEDLFELPKKSELGFGLPPQSQIGITKGRVTSKTIGKGSELEVLEYGTVKNVERVGRTTIKGQGIDIYKFELGKGKGTGKRFIPRTSATGRVSGEAAFTSSIKFSRLTGGISSPKSFSVASSNIQRGKGVSFPTPRLLNKVYTPSITQKPPTVRTPKITTRSIFPTRTTTTATRKRQPIKTSNIFRPPKINFGFQSKRTKGKASPFSVSRKPTLVALGENIFASRKAKGEVSGLVIRPIIEDKKKKRRSSIFSRTTKF